MKNINNDVIILIIIRSILILVTIILDGLPSDGITVEYSYISVEEFIISVSIVLPVFCIHIALLAFLIIFRNNK